MTVSNASSYEPKITHPCIPIARPCSCSHTAQAFNCRVVGLRRRVQGCDKIVVMATPQNKGLPLCISRSSPPTSLARTYAASTHFCEPLHRKKSWREADQPSYRATTSNRRPTRSMHQSTETRSNHDAERRAHPKRRCAQPHRTSRIADQVHQMGVSTSLRRRKLWL